MNELASTLHDAMNVAIRRGVEDFDHRQAEAVAAAWEAAGPWRPLMVLMWLRILGQLERDEPERLMEHLRGAIDFVFRFMGKRSTGVFFDGLALLVRFDEQTHVKILRLAQSSPYATRGRMEAAVHGMTGSHYFDPDRYARIADLDLRK